MTEPADVFISYSREDKDRVLALAAQLREADRAIDALRRALAAGYWDLGWMRHDPDLDPLREDIRFQSLLAGA